MATRAEPLIQTAGRRLPTTGVFKAVDHQSIGLRYLITGLLFFCLAGIEALLMRLQLSTPENTLLSPDVYNQLLTMHGTTMVFFFAVPVLFGFGSFLVPLMIGAGEMAFPRLNAFGYWVFLLSGLFMSSSMLFGTAPSGSMFASPPLMGPQYSPGLNVDFWSFGLLFLSISLFAGAINLIITLLKRRSPGMPVKRMPLFAWAILIASILALVVVLALDAANILLILERRFGFHFFETTGGPLLWKDLFGFFGQPAFYLILLPALGIVCEVVSAFSRRPFLGYSLAAGSLVAAGILGLGTWGQQLFVTSLSPLAILILSIISALNVIPLGILVAAWLGTLLTGSPIWKVPLIWVGGLIILIVLGALAGLMLAVPVLNRQATNTYFFNAYLHTVLAGGGVFAMFAGFYYWFPKISGRMLNERLGKVHFWLFFSGSILMFLPMYILGFMGMPAGVYTYRPGLGWEDLNLLATIGAFLIAESILIFIINLIASLSHGELAGDNPWDGSSPEWAAISPSEPGHFYPGGSLAPFLLAVSLLILFLGLLLSVNWGVGVGAVLSIAVVLFWLESSRLEGKNDGATMGELTDDAKIKQAE